MKGQQTLGVPEQISIEMPMHIFIVLLLWSALGNAQSQWRTTPEYSTAHALDPLPELPPDWISITDPYATVHANPQQQGTANHLSEVASQSIPRVAAELGLPIGNRIHIYLSPTQEMFLEMQPGRPPHWADGTAWPKRGIIFLRAPKLRDGTDKPLSQVLDHELAHIILGRAFYPKMAPSWLQEGVAQLAAREYSPRMTQTLNRGVLANQLLTINELTSRFPSDPIRAELAYAQSADLVAHIRDNYGEAALHVVIDQMAEGESFTAAIRRATGRDITEIEKQWTKNRRASASWIQPLSTDSALLAMAALLLLGFGVAAIRRRKRRLSKMFAEQARRDEWYARLIETVGESEPTSDPHSPGVQSNCTDPH